MKTKEESLHLHKISERYLSEDVMVLIGIETQDGQDNEKNFRCKLKGPVEGGMSSM